MKYTSRQTPQMMLVNSSLLVRTQLWRIGNQCIMCIMCSKTCLLSPNSHYSASHAQSIRGNLEPGEQIFWYLIINCILESSKENPHDHQLNKCLFKGIKGWVGWRLWDFLVLIKVMYVLVFFVFEFWNTLITFIYHIVLEEIKY